MKYSSTPYGLLGRNLGASLSKTIHESAMRELGIPGSYGVFDIASEAKAKDFISDFFDNGGQGLNITAPYKFVAAHFFKKKSRPLNTLTPTDGFCTDAVGLTQSLNLLGLKWSDFANVVMIGGGATVLTLLDYWATHNHAFASVSILARSTLKKEIRDYLLSTPLIHGELEITPFRKEVLREIAKESCATTLIINAASAVSGGDDLSEFVESIQGYRGFYQELTYGLSLTALYQSLKQAQPSRTADGLSMLIEQAREAQRIWWGRTVDSSFLQNCVIQV